MEILLKSSLDIQPQQLEWMERLVKKYNVKMNITFCHELIKDISLELITPILNDSTYEKVHSLYDELQNDGITNIAERYIYNFNNDEYEAAPFLIIQGVGNTAGCYDTRSTKSFTSEVICNTCHRIKLTQTAPLVVNTASFQRRMAMIVNHQLVISEEFANLLSEWGMKGYTLKRVNHRGKPEKSQLAYQVIPNEYMPKCSEQWKRLYYLTEDNRCCDCYLTGYINSPYTYDSIDLQGLDNDFYTVLEPQARVTAYYNHEIVISQRLRQNLIEYGITKNKYSMFHPIYKSKDWAFKPIVTINGG